MITPLIDRNGATTETTIWTVTKPGKFESSLKHRYMQDVLQLKQFQFTVPVPAAAVNRLQATGAMANQLPLMYVDINFVLGKFKLDGNWAYIYRTNCNRFGTMPFSNERIMIQADVFSGASKSDHNRASGDCVFCLNGYITIGGIKRPCTGLLVLEAGSGMSKGPGNSWLLCCYLYDSTTDDCEISFRLPFYTGAKNHLS